MAEANFLISWSALARRFAGFGLLVMLFVTMPAVARVHNFSVAESAPRLAFTMTDAASGKKVTAADFRGKVVMLYLGYTQCQDICPLTLHNIAAILHRLGSAADEVRVLFVTVDPNRDTLPLLKRYTAAFAPEIIGLRGTPDELARLARRYRLGYSVSPATKTRPYEVMHSSGVYVFGREGGAKLLVTSMASRVPGLRGTTAEIKRLLHEPKSGFLANVRHLL